MMEGILSEIIYCMLILPKNGRTVIIKFSVHSILEQFSSVYKLREILFIFKIVCFRYR